jgi:FecR protein
MNRIRVRPYAILIILGIAIIAGAGMIFLRKYEPSASAKGLPNAARIERVDGQVAINHSLDNTSNTQWIAATANAPITVGDRLYTRDNSRSEIAFTGRNFATVDANTSLDILDLSNQRTQVALREGSALFDVGSISSGQLFEVATPCGAIDLQQPGAYRINIDTSGNATATAFSGQAQVVGQAGSGTINKGEVLTVPCQGSSTAGQSSSTTGQGGSATISRVDYDQAGTYLDSYYRYRYPRTYDGRYRNYYTYLDDPYYYDPYKRYNSYHYVSEYIPGLYDLDDYGDWQYVSNYGYCWHPRVDTGWAPYEYGSWNMDYPYGLTWISTEPWGYAPYHYGRWTYASNEWFWVPGSMNYYPTYSPALTAFIPLGNSSIAWVALGPGDPYTSWYYDPYWQPVYLTSQPTVTTFVNYNVPGAISVIPVSQFGQVLDPRIITHVDRQTIVQYRPVLDPLTVDPLRKAAFSTRQAERRIDVPQSVVQQVFNKPVVTAGALPAPPFRRDLANALRVQEIPGHVRNQTLKLNDQRAATAQQATSGQVPNVAAEQARERQMADLARQAARGDRNAGRQIQQLRQQQMAEQRAQRVTNPQAQGERVGQPIQAQREDARQQMMAARQLQRAAQQQQRLENARGAGRQPQLQRVQPPPTRNAPQAQPLRPQVTRPQPQLQRRPEVQLQRQQSQPRVMAAPRQQPMPQARPQVERRGPPVQMRPQPQAVPRQQPMPQARPQVERRGPPVQMRPQPQAMSRPQPQAQPRMQRPQVQMQPRPQMQARPQPQAQPRQQAVRPQPQARPQGSPSQAAPAKGQGNPRKKPEKP